MSTTLKFILFELLLLMDYYILINGVSLGIMPSFSLSPSEDIISYPVEVESSFGLSTSNKCRHVRAAAGGKAQYWPNAIVPYRINVKLSHSQNSTLYKAFERFHNHTCIRFVPRTNERDYINIVDKKDKCCSHVGRTGGGQPVNLHLPGCLSHVRTPLHELMHALGIIHEHKRSDRDKFVHINKENIQPGKEHNFERDNNSKTFGFHYDYKSIMHYGRKTFSKNKNATIQILDPKVSSKKFRQANDLSSDDIKTLNKLYCQNRHFPKHGPLLQH